MCAADDGEGNWRVVSSFPSTEGAASKGENVFQKDQRKPFSSRLHCGCDGGVKINQAVTHPAVKIQTEERKSKKYFCGEMERCPFFAGHRKVDWQ